MKPYERLIKYAKFPTASDESNDACPSTEKQLIFAKALESELIQLGCTEVTLDKNCYLFATIPASEGFENVPVIGFIAHMDVSPEVEDNGVNPQVINYSGGDIVLNEKLGIAMKESDFPILKKYRGKTLVTTDGTTLLGADDKAGIAEIISAAEILISDKSKKHGKIRIGFTPDEEIGRGADLFDVEKFGAKYAYTVDGASFGEVDYETFNASALRVTINGKSIHPGDAKDKMINASIAATEYIALLPPLERPEHTCGYQGFYHLTGMEGNVEKATLHFILRDHDMKKLEVRQEMARRAADELNRRYGENTVEIEIKESYRNMREKIEPEFHIVENAYKAVKSLGGVPVSNPVRGGTDGSRLSFMGLPCPNLGTGSHNHHGRFEFACAEEMDKCTELVVKIAEIYAQNR